MGVTLGLVANIYNEVNALPGWLEAHLPHFDDLRLWHAGPGGELSNDGTMDIISRWGVPLGVDSINDGFGAVRTRAVRSSPCDYVMLLDADERFYAYHRVLTCTGRDTPQAEVDWILQSYDYSGVNLPNWENIEKLGAGLRVGVGPQYNQIGYLRDLLNTERPDAVCTIRRHWHDLAMQRPTQDWGALPDWQMRLVRNHPSIYYDPTTRMHERLIGAQKVIHASPDLGPFFDHFHFHFKRMEPEQRRHDIAIYDAVHKGEMPPTRIGN